MDLVRAGLAVISMLEYKTLTSFFYCSLNILSALKVFTGAITCFGKSGAQMVTVLLCGAANLTQARSGIII